MGFNLSVTTITVMVFVSLRDKFIEIVLFKDWFDWQENDNFLYKAVFLIEKKLKDEGF